MDSWKKSNLTITSYLCNDDFHMFVKISGWRKFDNETEFLLSRVGGGRQWWSAERYDSRSWCAADVLDLHHTPQGRQFSLRLIATDRTEISHSTTLPFPEAGDLLGQIKDSYQQRQKWSQQTRYMKEQGLKGKKQHGCGRQSISIHKCPGTSASIKRESLKMKKVDQHWPWFQLAFFMMSSTAKCWDGECNS